MNTKKAIAVLSATGLLVLMACNQSGSKPHEAHEAATDTSQHVNTTDEQQIKTVTVTYNNLDPQLKTSVNELVDHYLHIKNALATDNSDEAAVGGKAMEKVLNKIDKSLFTAEQKKVYDEVEDDTKENAEHIGENAGNIKHQRSHFASLSEDVYTLVKAFGSGRALYHDHCPMYNNNQGAMWISEIKQVKNPYFGAEMPTCGTIEEVIQ